MGSKQAAPPTQTTTQILAPEQRELLNLALPGVREFSATVPQRYGGSTTAGFNPTQEAAQTTALGAAGTQADIAGTGKQASDFFLSGDIWKPESNPALTGAIEAATRPITQTYERSVLPQIRTDAIKAGGFGGSRQGVAEGIASQGVSQAVGDTASKLVQNQYETNIKAQLGALGLLPTVQAAQVTPAVTTGAVGDVRQAMEQARLNDIINNFNYDQLAPFLQSREIISLVQGIPGGSVQTVGSTPGQPGKGQQALGGALQGAQIGGMVGGPWGAAAGAVGGGLMPFLF